MLDKKKFLAIKKLAKKVREANEDVFNEISNEPLEKAIKDKDELISKVTKEINFSDGEKGKEEKQMFRAAVLIPDDEDFYNVYFEDKNIRSLMNRYAVSIEDIMSKITELNIYGNYLEEINEVEEKDVTSSGDFVDEMVNLSFENAESLLTEIEGLAVSMEKELKISDDEIEDTETVSEDNDDEEHANEEVVEEEDVDFDSMSHAVSGFVEDYDRIKNDLNMAKEELEKATENSSALMESIEKLKLENNELKQNNLESANSIKEVNEKYRNVLNQNAILRERNGRLEEKIKQSSELLKRIYDSIPKSKK